MGCPVALKYLLAKLVVKKVGRKKFGVKKVFSIRLEPYVLRDLEEYAEKRNIRASNIVRLLLREFVKFIKMHTELMPDEAISKFIINSNTDIHINNKYSTILMSSPRIQINRKVHSFYLNEEIFEEIQKFSEECGLSTSELVNSLLYIFVHNKEVFIKISHELLKRIQNEPESIRTSRNVLQINKNEQNDTLETEAQKHEERCRFCGKNENLTPAIYIPTNKAYLLCSNCLARVKEYPEKWIVRSDTQVSISEGMKI